MKYIKLHSDECSPSEFIVFWSSLYRDSKESFYIPVIDKQKFDIGDINNLFEWKNGVKLSQKKKQSLNINIINKLEIINKLKHNFNLSTFQEEFGRISAIWKIFLLHIIASDRYPIFDQHVFRSYYFLKHNEVKEISYKNKEKEEIYFKEYLEFFNSLHNNLINADIPKKKIDEALWVFGRFLKSDYGKILFQ
ncbi:MAG: hypothetical protein V1886_00295 [archaeon]